MYMSFGIGITLRSGRASINTGSALSATEKRRTHAKPKERDDDHDGCGDFGYRGG